MKEAYYFSHDSNASQDEKILNMRADCGWEGYGIYWAIIERLRDTEGHRYALTSIKGLAASLGIKTVTLTEIIKNYGLFESDGDYFWSNSLIERMKIVEAKREDARQKGIKSGEVRSGKMNHSSTAVEPQLNHSSTAVKNSLNQSSTELEQGKEILKGNEKKVNLVLDTHNSAIEKKIEILEVFEKNGIDLTGGRGEIEFEAFVAFFDEREWKTSAGEPVKNPVNIAKTWNFKSNQNHQKTNGTNGRSSNIRPSGYAESIANADRIIESIARSQ